MGQKAEEQSCGRSAQLRSAVSWVPLCSIGNKLLAATVLLRAMLVFALSAGRTKRYRHAAEHLRSCELLAARIDAWQGVELHESFLGRIREAFGGRWSFWSLVER